jgi:hypothetical protein
MDIGNPNYHVLLTGAGFSFPMGGRLAKEVRTGLLRRTQVDAEPELRRRLIENQSFEEVLALVRKELSHREIQALESGLMEVFESMDRDIAENHHPDGKVNIYGFQKFMGQFARSDHSGADCAFLFTLNQDLMVERRWYNVPHDGFYPSRPGVAPSHRFSQEGHQWFSTLVPRYDSSFLETVPESPIVDFRRNANYVKLHGGFNWRRSDGSNAMVVGTQKTQQIEEVPLLRMYFEAFRRVLLRPSVKLMVVGYSFCDEHINEVISHAVESHGLKVHIWDPYAWDLVDRLSSHARWGVISQAVTVWERRMHQVFPGDQSETEEWRQMREEYFDLRH